MSEQKVSEALQFMLSNWEQDNARLTAQVAELTQDRDYQSELVDHIANYAYAKLKRTHDIHHLFG